MKKEAINGKPHAWLEAWKVASGQPRRGSLFSQLMKPACACVIAVFVTSGSLQAATRYSTKGSGSTDQLTNSTYWDDAGANPWPNSADDYVLKHGVVRGPDSNVSFNGRSFQMGIVGGNEASMAIKGGNITFANEGLVLAKGYFTHWADNREIWIGGKVTVLSPKAAPFVFKTEKDVSGHALSGDLYGAADVSLSASANGHNNGYSFRLAGDLSNYAGEIAIGDHVAFTCGNDKGSRTCPGTISIGKSSRLILPYTNSTLTVAGISFDVGSVLRVRLGHIVDDPICSTLIPTGSLTLPATGPLRIEMNETLPIIRTGQAAPKYEVLRVAKSVRVISLSDFELDRTNAEGFEGNVFLPQNAQLVLDETDDGVQVLSIQPNKIVRCVANDASGASAFLPAWANHWQGMSVGEVLSPDVDYYAENNQIRTPETSANPEDWVFKGHSLTFRQGIFVLKGRPTTVVSNLTMRAGSSIENWGGGTPTAETPGGVCEVDGKLTTACATSKGAWEFVALKAQDGRGIVLRSDISGSTGLSFECDGGNPDRKKKGAATGCTPHFELAGDNSAFGSLLVLKCDVDYPKCSPVLKISDARNLGGPMWNGKCLAYAVWIRNGNCLQATKSLTLAEPTRGIFAQGVNGENVYGARFRADEGVTLTIDGSPLAMSGRLVKEGAGKLAVGGTLRYIDDATNTMLAEPVAGKNLVHVEEGSLQALSTGAFDKAKLSFGAKGTLAVGMPKAGGDAAFAKYGAVLTANDAPFDGPQVPVTVVGDAASFGSGGVSVPVFTVTKAAVANLSVKAVKPAKGYRLTAELRENAGEGTVTCWATVAKTGMVLLFR